MDRDDRDQTTQDDRPDATATAASDGHQDAFVPAPRRKLKNQSSVDEIGRAFQEARDRERGPSEG